MDEEKNSTEQIPADQHPAYLFGKLTALVESVIPEFEKSDVAAHNFPLRVSENPLKSLFWFNEVSKLELESLSPTMKSEYLEAYGKVLDMLEKNPKYSVEKDGGRFFIGYYHEKSRHTMQLTRQKIGNRIRELREKKGMTLRELGERCDIAYNHISRIEAGKYNISLDTLAKLSAALDCEITIL